MPQHWKCYSSVSHSGEEMNTNMTGFRWFSIIFASLFSVPHHWKRYSSASHSGEEMNTNMTGFRWFSIIFASLFYASALEALL